MPHGQTWFNLLPFFDDAEHAAAQWLGKDGHTWLMHEHVSVQHVFGFVFVLLLLLVFAVLTASKIRNVKQAMIPGDKLTIATFMELLVGASYSMMSDIMGKKAAKFFLPLIGTCALVILFSNLLGLVPGFWPPTSNLNTTLPMGMVIFFATHIFGFKENGLAYAKHFLGPLLAIAPLMLLIELISHAVRPASLAIRLMANMTADHAVVDNVSGLVPWVVPAAPLVLGTLVCVVQTLVFCLLSTTYISMAIAHDH